MSDNRLLKRCYKQESAKVTKKLPNIISILILLADIFHLVVRLSKIMQTQELG